VCAPSEPTVNFHGQRRSNATHQSATDPEARLTKKGRCTEAHLTYAGPALMEQRNGVSVDRSIRRRVTPNGPSCQTSSTGPACEAFVHGRWPAIRPYDTRHWVADVRVRNLTSHVAQNTSGRRGAIDQRATAHAGYSVSQRKRKRVEEIIGWLKTIGGLQ